MIERVISGGQTGADQAGLRVARTYGIPTGGWAPRGWLVEGGSAPWLAEFGLTECAEPRWEKPPGMRAWEWEAACYKARTKANAVYADVTLYFLDKPSESRGYRATIKHATTFISIVKDDRTRTTSTPDGLVKNFGDALSGILNVAGNRESSAPGIGAWVERYLAEVFALTNPTEAAHADPSR